MPLVSIGMRMVGCCCCWMLTAILFAGVGLAQEKMMDDATREHARSLSLAFRHASESALPSVVKILSKTKQPGVESSFLENRGDDRQRFDSVGSGVIVSEDGWVLTNHHVIQDAERVEVRLTDGREFVVKETKSDPDSDVAIIQLDIGSATLPIAQIGDSDDLFVGDWVLAIGSPFMLDASVSAGIISSTGRRRELSDTVKGLFLQTDAAINPGNSGGPLIDLDGQVVGINTAISSRSGGFQGIGFAIPINRATWIKKELLENGKVRRGYVGVRASDVPYSVAEQLQLPRTAAALVNAVTPFRPGQRAGLKSGDVILEFAGQVVMSAADFSDIVQQSPIGEPLKLVVFREGEELELTVTLEELISR